MHKRFNAYSKEVNCYVYDFKKLYSNNSTS